MTHIEFTNVAEQLLLLKENDTIKEVVLNGRTLKLNDFISLNESVYFIKNFVFDEINNTLKILF